MILYAHDLTRIVAVPPEQDGGAVVRWRGRLYRHRGVRVRGAREERVYVAVAARPRMAAMTTSRRSTRRRVRG